MKRVVNAGGIRLEYILIQSVRRTVLAKALPGGEVRVYAPSSMGLRAVDSFVREHAAELIEMGKRVDAAADAERKGHPVADGEKLMVEGMPRVLQVTRGKHAYALTETELIIRCECPEDEKSVRDAVRRALAEYSIKRFEERLKLYGSKMNVTYGRVTIREQRTRWGSCSSKHNLNFNWKLIMAPREALDYVVIHELCHLTEFNHSPRFWALVEAQMPEYRFWKKWLADHGKELGV